MEDSRELVFVYGTLRRGASNAFRMEGAEHVGRATVRGRLYRIDSNRDFVYPALVHDPRAVFVYGDVFAVPPEIMAALDDYEGDEYDRTEIPLASADPNEPGNRPKTAWAWLWSGSVEGFPRIPDGDWLDAEFPPAKPLYATLGCVALLALPVGTGMLIALLDQFLTAEVGVVMFLTAFSIPLAGATALFLLWASHRRRESPRSPWVGLLQIGVAIGGVIMLVAGAVGVIVRIFDSF